MKQFMKRSSILLQAGACALLPFAAQAEDKTIPSVSSELVVELQSQKTYQSKDDDTLEREDTFARSELAPTVTLHDNLYADAVLVFERVQDVPADANNTFNNEGAFVEEAKLNYENGPWTVWGGKFNPRFGSAWDYGRGIWGEDFAEDYEITEKVGLGGAYLFETEKLGDHTLCLTSFFSDTSFLSRSAITARTPLEERDGGASNTEDLSSYTVLLDGVDLVGVENLSYHLSFRHLEKSDYDDPALDDQNGMAFNTRYVVSPMKNLEFDGLFEYANIQNFNDTLDDYQYVTGSLITRIYEDWNITVAGTTRKINPYDSIFDVTDHLYQVSGGYDFGNGFTFEVGYRQAEETEVTTKAVGALARYSKEF